MVYTKLGDLLRAAGLLTEEQLHQALAHQKESKKRLGQELIDSGIITEQQLIEVLQMQLGVEFVDLSRVSIPAALAGLLPKNIAKKHGIVPVKEVGGVLYIAMSDPLNFVAIEEVKTATRKRVTPMIATAAAIERTLAALYGNEGAARAIEEMKRELGETAAPLTDSFTAGEIGEDGQSAPTVRLVNSLIERAVAERASDIHLEPYENELRVRLRVDGMLQKMMTVPKNLQNSVISRLKIMGGMDITERRIPQDGRASVRVQQSELDLRMSTLPTIYGEKFVIRLLNKDTHLLNKTQIGLTGEDLKKYQYLLDATGSGGVILIVGPTGSGKSSTMYTMIRELNREEVNLVTLEDPAEYNIDGINQVQINEKTGLTFASGLRSILRQDPDIVAVGEIRDGETAEIAMRAAMTGHLVLSTIHTNSTLATIDRLMDIGVEPYLIASAVNGIISQRLVRRICPDCREEYQPEAEELRSIGLPENSPQKFYRGRGCPACYGTGYRGRTGVFEILLLDHAMKNAIEDGASREKIAEVAMSSGHFTTLAENCRRLAASGVTTISEARRATAAMEYRQEG